MYRALFSLLILVLMVACGSSPSSKGLSEERHGEEEPPVPSLECLRGDDCEGRERPSCDGSWACEGGSCAWHCAQAEPPPCDEIFQEVEAEQSRVAACLREGSTCLIEENPFCSEDGVCETLVSGSADLTRLRALAGEAERCGASSCAPCGESSREGRCRDGTCVWEEVCEYTCDLPCACQQDARGCDLPLCEDLCEAPADCEGREHPDCPGAWSCQEGSCQWICDEPVSCEALQAEILEHSRGFGGCEAPSDCSLIANPLCGVQGGCFLYTSRENETAEVRRLQREYLAQGCPTSACECVDPIAFECVDGRCQGVLPDPCASYTCDLPCPCKKNELGCDLPICADACVGSADCEGLEHGSCEGRWACIEGQCAWECVGEDCQRLRGELEAHRNELSSCDEGDVCKSADNLLCGNAGGCFLFYKEGVNFERLGELEDAFRGGNCFRPFCNTTHCELPPEAVCLEGRCQAIP